MSERTKRHKDRKLIRRYNSDTSHCDKKIERIAKKINAYCQKNYEFQPSILNLGECGVSFLGNNLIKIDPTIALLNKSFLTFICAHECAHMVYYDKYKQNSTEEWADEYAAIYMAISHVDITGVIKILMKLPKRKTSNNNHPDSRLRAYNIYKVYNCVINRKK